MIRTRYIVLGGTLAGFLAGLGMGWKVYRPAPVPPAVDKPHPAEPLPGGGLVVAEQPTAKLLPVPQGLPKTTLVVRQVELAVQPDNRPIEDWYAADPVKVTLSLVKQPEGTLRVVATAEGGTVVGGLDIPYSPAPVTVQVPVAKDLHWAVMAERVVPLDRAIQPAWGGVVQYAKGPFVGGLGVNRYEVRLSAGIRF